MFRHTHAGFTLVEVVAAMGAFTVAFLAGFAAIGTFMIRQDMNYQRTVASAAVMLIADRHAHHSAQLSATSAAAATQSSLREICIGSSATHAYLQYVTPTMSKVRFKGGDMDKINDKIFVFRTGAIKDPLMVDPVGSASPARVNLNDYQNIIVTMSVPNTEADSGIDFTQVSLWYGYREDLINNVDTTVEFLGRFLVADRVR